MPAVMKYSVNRGSTSFFVTSPLPCPYLDGQVERRLVAELKGWDGISLHDTLSKVGFRRSHGIVYAPICPSCRACLAVRTVVGEFKPSASQKRVIRINKDIVVNKRPALATHEQYALFVKYQETRHRGGDMATMDYYDYQALIEETTVNTFILEYRDLDHLVGACIVDEMADGLSAVYSFFDPTNKRKSLGTQIIMALFDLALQYRLPHVYLGYWVSGSQKMSYKEKFQPLEYYNGNEWTRSDLFQWNKPLG